MPDPYFFFGSLRDPDVLAVVLGRAVAASELRPAELPGYVAVLAEEERLPVLVPRAAGIVHGVVAEIPDRHERDRVTFFEETEYRPEVKEVRLLEGGTVRALVHTDTSLATEAREQWSFERWRREDKAQMLVLARGWMRHLADRDHAAADAEWDRALAEMTVRA